MDIRLLPDGRIVVPQRAVSDPDPNNRVAVGHAAMTLGPDDPRYAELRPLAREPQKPKTEQEQARYDAKRARVRDIMGRIGQGRVGFADSPAPGQLTGDGDGVSEPLARLIHGLDGIFDDVTAFNQMNWLAEEQDTLDWAATELAEVLAAEALTLKVWQRVAPTTPFDLDAISEWARQLQVTVASRQKA